MEVRKSTELMSLDELMIGKRAKNYLNGEYASLDEIVLAGRKIAHNKGNKTPKSMIELADALKAAGFVREDFRSDAFCINRLYYDVFNFVNEEILDRKTYPCYFPDIASNEVYESFSVPTEKERMKVLDSLGFLSARSLAIIGYRYGFTSTTHSIDETAEHFEISHAKVVETETLALRKICAHRRDLPHVLPATAEQETEIKDIIQELNEFYHSPAFSRVRQLRTKLQRAAKQPFTCANEAREYLLEGIADRYGNDAPIDMLNIPLRAYNCLMRAGIDTVGKIVRATPVQWGNIRNMNRAGYDAIVDAMHDYGYTSFEIKFRS